MLLKPATPLTILLLIAFALLLISVISTPIIKGIPLATYENVDYGVFGYCKGDVCTNIHVGYANDDMTSEGNEFNLPPSTRRSLSAILIVHPVAAFLTLICLCLAAAAHFHAPSHSPRYLLALLILLLPTLLVSLLAFLVDILLFVPHMAWAGWIVLVATIILVTCGVVTCAMRRTLVSRKARKKRIAENAEMSGENFYNRQNAAAAAAGLNNTAPMHGDTKEPVVTGFSPASDTGPTFATFRTPTHDSDDDRTPLNSRNPPSDHPLPDNQYTRAHGDVVAYNAPPEDTDISPVAPTPGPRMRNQYSDGSMGSRRGPPPPGGAPRGRGYPPRGGYGRGAPYGGPGSRGPPPGMNGGPGPMGPMRGGHPGAMGRGGYRGPLPGGYVPGPRPTPPPEDEYEFRRASPVDIARQPSPGPIGMAMSPDNGSPIGQAIEMQPQPRRVGSADPEAHDVILEPLPHAVSADGYPEPISPTSLYSRTSYVPARAGWAPDAPPVGHTPSPVHAYGAPPVGHTPSPVHAYGAPPVGHTPSPVHAYGAPPVGHTPSPVHAYGGAARRHVRTPSTDYFEDADPRFAIPNESSAGNPRLPAVLTPGTGEKKPVEVPVQVPSSPTTSEVSHFTSISERPINPRWRPPPMPNQRKQDVLLENNPDFDLRAGTRGGAAGVGSRMPPMSIPRDTARYPI
ncbi:pali-domain-containing protein [Aspergillus heteromorphus CBS 117.55]|uniref:Pali-domain-containing protein n=1 Tax=Aspergillus heteromorphus CBS 117.55 TaxID=1448321 RepID=A0A317X8B9_9EURO|nr:pali-domain-containing protein [Aspergillus heteromorphus CBS 117.55]PWY92820.1 pali-domain-containing protein [Aspergillus heteromorphus CBS 117.55]